MHVPEEDYWAIDGTVLQYGNGKLYFIWSGWPEIDSGFPQNLYIAEMCDPLTICSRRVLIKTVDYSWERNGAELIEGPQILHNAGRVFVVYSASGSWTAGISNFAHFNTQSHSFSHFHRLHNRLHGNRQFSRSTQL